MVQCPEITHGSGSGELNPGSNQHVETSRDAVSHDAKIHEGSDDGNTGTPLQGQGGEQTDATRTRRSAGQAYQIAEWNHWHLEHEEDEAEDREVRDTAVKNEFDRCIASLTLGRTGRRQCKRNQRDEYDDGESESEEEQLVCNMIGDRWGSLPFPVIIDSGACASVMPTDWCPHVEATSTPESRAKEFVRVANGHKIYNEGQKVVIMTTREGTTRDMKFTVCDVPKALGSVSLMRKTGHRVVLNPPREGEGSYIEYIYIYIYIYISIETDERMWLEEKGGLYILGAKVAPKHKQTYMMQNGGNDWHQDFHWQAHA